MDESHDGGRTERELAEQLAAVRGASGRRRWPLVALGVAVGVVLAVVASSLTGGDGDGDTETVTEGLLAVAEVTTADLVSFRTYDGVLGFGDPTQVSSPVDAVVTRSAAVDDELVRGDVLLHLNGEPVVVWYGDAPLFRDVGPATGAGDDVASIEQNLAVLGFDADGALLVDGWYDAATEQAVIAWQESIGAEPDGVVDRDAVVMVGGPVRVADAPVVGSSAYAGTVLVELTRLERRMTAALAPADPPEDETDDGEAPADDEEVEAPPAVERTPVGAIGSLPSPGSAVVAGDVVFRVDGAPTIALVEPDRVGRALVNGDDAAVGRELERAGHADVAAWAAATGLAVDTAGASFVEVPEGATVAEVFVADGDGVAAGDPVLETRATTQRVEVDLPVTDLDELAVGDVVDVEFPDGEVVAAVVAERGTVAQVEVDQAGNRTTTVDVRIELTGDATGSIEEGPVTVRAVDEEIPAAVVVPVRALLSLAEGGFAVEVVEVGGTTRLVGVETGTFSDGLVEVTNGAVSPGDSLVVPG